eukprot:7012609-Prymnesium_polylepis.3
MAIWSSIVAMYSSRKAFAQLTPGRGAVHATAELRCAAVLPLSERVSGWAHLCRRDDATSEHYDERRTHTLGGQLVAQPTPCTRSWAARSGFQQRCGRHAYSSSQMKRFTAAFYGENACSSLGIPKYATMQGHGGSGTATT